MNNYTANRKRYVFWQHRLSAHQAPFVKVLADLPVLEEVVLVVNGGLSQERLAQGWNPPDYGKTKILVKPNAQVVDALVKNKALETVHVFSFLSSDKKILDIFYRCYGTGALLGLLSEGRDWRGFKGFARQVHGRFNERQYQEKLDFVLAIGKLSKIWYSKNNVALEKLYDFCYVVEDEQQLIEEKEGNDETVKLIYVGQLIIRKRVDLLIKALSLTEMKNFTLEIVGTGSELHQLQEMSVKLGLDKHITFLGVLNNTEVSERVRGSDVLVLPSHWDGWGAVVNEALMCGTPVICSNYCGAADLIQKEFGSGEVFECDSTQSLVSILKKWLLNGTTKPEVRAKIKEYSHSINGTCVAKYLTEIVDFEDGKQLKKPKAPWFNGQLT